MAGLSLSLARSFGAGVHFNVLACTSGLKSDSEGEMVLLGDEEGKIHLLDPLTGAIETVLETKGGSIMCLKAHPITKLSRCDLLSGDAQGVVSLFSNLELLSRQALSGAITAITVAEEQDGIPRIFSGDSVGSLVSMGGLDLDISSSFSLPSPPNSPLPFVCCSL